MADNLNATNTTRFAYSIRFNYQSQDIDFGTWISLFTLCLAPLVAHLIAGTPNTVYLHDSRPRWHETVVHYNPTAIIWRYFAVTDRRIRARNWNPTDMAAGNALFWTSHGWDGSAEMMVKSRDLCIQIPSSTLRRLFSIGTLKTVVVALQGAQAFYLIGGSLSRNLARSGGSLALDTIFMPLAILGLLRLLAALWLSDEPLFVSNENYEKSKTTSLSRSDRKRRDSTESAWSLLRTKPDSYSSGDMMLHSLHPTHSYSTTTTPTTTTDLARHFRPPTSPLGLILRLLVLLFLLAALTLALLQMLGTPGGGPGDGSTFSVTTFLMGCFYTIFILASIVICSTYFIKSLRRSSSLHYLPTTIIPCIDKLWFKLYTGLLIVGAVVMIFFACLETRQSPCGPFTTFDRSQDVVICGEGDK